MPATRMQAQIREEGRQAFSDAEDLDRAAISLQADIYRGQVRHLLGILAKERSENLRYGISPVEAMCDVFNCAA